MKWGIMPFWFDGEASADVQITLTIDDEAE